MNQSAGFEMEQENYPVPRFVLKLWHRDERGVPCQVQTYLTDEDVEAVADGLSNDVDASEDLAKFISFTRANPRSVNPHVRFKQRICELLNERTYFANAFVSIVETELLRRNGLSAEQPRSPLDVREIGLTICATQDGRPVPCFLTNEQIEIILEQYRTNDDEKALVETVKSHTCFAKAFSDGLRSKFALRMPSGEND